MIHFTSPVFLCLSNIVRLFRGSAAFRPAFAQFVSCLAANSARYSERFLTRFGSPSAFALAHFLVDEIDVHRAFR